ncbi:murein L,D-transpeptidase catalytic domain family protein [Hymenobacter guriensis]|uniref:Murein L,D-transpeptidase catalytic domain family protein n=1 Tax=Hymenobacter guriensis TaxID=2793065 RepID=A0ABS0KYH6_9BACT|nr:murein L,D-transpeptidase catalytic domain family protein [Hymenobacter guriensis]MBG8552911.1 murein L,D-transpeptidase catalytic domain family protein [Hymenobacter guriensis]
MEKPSVIRRNRLKRRARRAARRILPFVASLFMATPLATPMGSAKATGAEYRVPTASEPRTSAFNSTAHQLYSELGAEATGLRYEVFQKALTGYLNLRHDGRLSDDKQLLTVIDFEKPSTEKRLWVLDLAGKHILFNTLVAHGHNSGENVATTFSNENESNMSSLGFYVTQGEYQGKHGRSLKLEGVDEGYNDNAMSRSVVMHGAEYVSEDFIKQFGRLGRSLGCPALPMDQYNEIISTVTGGTCLFLNGADAQYSSKYLNQDVALQTYFQTGALV